MAVDQGREPPNPPTTARYRLPPMSAAKNMDRWLGNGGMPIIDVVGGGFTG